MGALVRSATVLGMLLVPVSASPASLDEILRPDVVHRIALSPDGKRVAVAEGNQSGVTKAIVVLGVDQPAANSNSRRIALGSERVDTVVRSLEWANNSILVAAIQADTRPASQGPLQRQPLPHIIETTGDGRILPVQGLLLPARIAAEPNPTDAYIYVIGGTTRPVLFRAALDTGRAERIEEGDPVTIGWRIRGGRAVVKFNQGRQGAIANIYARLTEDSQWTYVNSLRYPQDRRNHETVIGHAIAPLEDYMRVTRTGVDVDGIHRRDLTTMQIVKTYSELPDLDAWSALLVRGEYRAVRYVDGNMKLSFADREAQRRFEDLVSSFDSETSVNVLQIDESDTNWLLHTYGPRNPGAFYVYDIARRHKTLVATSKPWLAPDQLAPAKTLAIRTRDGQEIKAILTCPEGLAKASLPLVVMPPAGPWSTAYLRFSPTVQALTAQGWCVVEPAYRGTYGRGRSFQAAGYGEWYGRVVNDIIDTVSFLIQSGIADETRIAAYGEMLAGTAVLAAEVGRPGLFRAIVACEPIVDPQLMLDDKRNRFGKLSVTFEDWSTWLGDLTEVKPLSDHASDLKSPILLVHSKVSADVPEEQTRQLAAALKRASAEPSVLWLDAPPPELPDSDNELPRLEAAIAFLRKHLALVQVSNGF